MDENNNRLMKGRSGVRGRIRCVRWREELDNSSKIVTIDGYDPPPPTKKRNLSPFS